ncbi:hypothetical protein [Actinomadura montaniterrae]|uniref:Uncharacterized protein n=1 Tax=Actinomadura montaniterrae TaxID=1803903 RepID=A0A6L3W728_9ACTN|nr:hypothetical protein [Actinomadura montaniterrae]KAB2388798.1 hypothetical protein F9B16_02425 [Actinomadura montaniterrae]
MDDHVELFWPKKILSRDLFCRGRLRVNVLAYTTADSIFLNPDSRWGGPAKMAELASAKDSGLVAPPVEGLINHEAGHLLADEILVNPEALNELNRAISGELDIPIEITLVKLQDTA